jgi:ketosteroid isomerase-like protein
MSESEALVREWLREMERCVGSLDYEGCRELFSDDVVGFGTQAFATVGLEQLERCQWREVWPQIRDFRFALGELRCRGDDGLIAASVPFDSRRAGVEGAAGDRPGRATIVLVDEGGALRAVHTHFSLGPA